MRDIKSTQRISMAYLHIRDSWCIYTKFKQKRKLTYRLQQGFRAPFQPLNPTSKVYTSHSLPQHSS